MTVGERCRSAREKAKLSQQGLADAVTRLGFKIGQSAIGNLEAGKTKDPRFVHELAQALGVTAEWLRYGRSAGEEGSDGKPRRQSSPSQVVVADVVLPSLHSMPKDVPVYGTASGGSGIVQLKGEAIDYVRRPPSLAGRTDVFALYIEDVSMVPAFAPGDLVFVEKRRPRVGDHAIIEYQDGPAGELRCLIKKFAGVTATTVRLEQYNPAKMIEVKAASVVRMQRVMTMADLFGV